ncbi:ArnT family glycosyltransferase [Haloarcula sp. CGMCC 1.6347]|uniref:ArnT family glycosyltransferase n=1 Tax=Haloarcula sp. CGMCC 1.6347 TaxID=3111455 RepID=UPI00300E7334
MSSWRSLSRRAVEQVRSDFRDDPYLRYVLLLSTVMVGFWFWHRIPNFATRDEYSRLLDAMVVYGSLLEEPSFEGLKAGVEWGRAPFGATLYLYALAILPVVLVAAITGDLGAFTTIAFPSWEFGHYEVWAATPEWIWTWSLVFIRLTNVVAALCAVYLTYRLGVAIEGRNAGRLSAVVLSLTFGFLTISKEAGEDMPALAFVLLALYLLVRYVQTDDGTLFLAASAAGGVAIAFKLTAAPVILLIGVAFLLRAHAADAPLMQTLYRPKLLLSGALLGFVMIILGFPTALVAGAEPFIERVFGGSTSRMSHPTGPDAPMWWWFLRGYFSALGLPLVAAAAASVVATVATLRDRGSAFHGTVLVLTGLVAYIAMFSQWHDFRVHHLLPTFPLIALLVGGRLVQLRERSSSLARPVMAVLLVTTAVYAGIGTAQFASMPRDEATAWLEDNSDEGDVVETYRVHIQDTAIPHSLTARHVAGQDSEAEEAMACPRYIQVGYRDLLYLKEDTYYRNGDAQATYLRALLNEEYNYRIAAEFGERPPNFVPQRPTPGSFTDLLRLGVVPHTDQFADEQELAANQYTLILERDGECDTSRHPPF